MTSQDNFAVRFAKHKDELDTLTVDKLETFEEANKMIDDYIYFYNHERIQLKTGLSPLSLRQSG